jgi:hypothetical protein
MVEMTLPASRAAAAADAPWWERAARGLWIGLAAIGRARAEREMLALAERCRTLQPELARELRMACSRPV